MRIDAYNDNPVVANQQQYWELEEKLLEIDPHCRIVQLRTDRLIIENRGRKTFQYPRTPSIDWVVGRLRYMVENGL